MVLFTKWKIPTCPKAMDTIGSRINLFVWGYFKLAMSTLTMCFFAAELLNLLSIENNDHGKRKMTLFGLLTQLIIEFLLVMLFLSGMHKRNFKIVRLYAYYVFVSILFFIAVVMSQKITEFHEAHGTNGYDVRRVMYGQILLLVLFSDYMTNLVIICIHLVVAYLILNEARKLEEEQDEKSLINQSIKAASECVIQIHETTEDNERLEENNSSVDDNTLNGKSEPVRDIKRINQKFDTKIDTEEIYENFETFDSEKMKGKFHLELALGDEEVNVQSA